MTELVNVLRSAVNTWECDEMGHMNVRFYVTRSVDALASFGQTIGLGPRVLRDNRQTLAMGEQHIRFLREIHPGTPFLISAGVVSANEDQLTIYQELTNLVSGQVSATFVVEARLADSTTRAPAQFSNTLIEQLQQQLIELPDHAKPRGISTAAPRTTPTIEEADTLGLFQIYQGIVKNTDTDEYGFMQPQGYMGSLSNGITHFFMAIKDQQKPREEGMGGAALEYRFVYRQPPRLGDIVLVRSGLKGIMGKATNFCHWMFNGESGDCIATVEAVAVSFDLKTRKAVEPSPESKDNMIRKSVKGLTL